MNQDLVQLLILLNKQHCRNVIVLLFTGSCSFYRHIINLVWIIKKIKTYRVVDIECIFNYFAG